MAIAGETWGEVLWSVYFALGKNRKLENFESYELLQYYESGNKKMSGFIKDNGLSSVLQNLNPSNIRDFDSMTKKEFEDKLVRLEWHDSTKYQVSNFIKNPKVKFLTTSNLKLTRQSEFYNLTGIENFIKKVKSIFDYDFTSDRWNPSDVWFYSDSSVKEIVTFLSSCITNESYVMSKLPKNTQKIRTLEDVKVLNSIILKMYEEKKLVPISLKKASGKKGSYSDRIALINTPKDKNNKPIDPVVHKKEYPIRSNGIIGSRNLKYDIKSQDAVLDKYGNIVYKDKWDHVQTDDKGTTFKMPGSKDFSAAQGGSFGIKDAQNVFYTAKGKRAIDKVREKSKFKNFPQQQKSNIISKGMSIRNGYDTEQVAQAKVYMDELCNILKPIVKNVDKKFDKNIKGTEKLRSIQNKLEVAVGIKESGIEDEIIIDLFNAIKSKSIVNRRDYEKILGRISKSILEKSKRKGQKRLTQEEADLQARSTLNVKMGSNYKLPSCFHLKLY